MLSIVRRYLSKAREIQKAIYPHLYNAALDMGITQGHKNYTRFIILGRSRTGSNLLRGLLNSHPQIVAFGELFRSEEMIDWGLPAYPQSPKLLSLFQRDPVAFLKANTFRTFPQSIRAVGFKIFYYHAHSEPWQPLWEYLFAQPEVKVLHIKRANMLKTVLSRKRAAITGHWVKGSETREQQPLVELNYEECLSEFIQTRKWEEEYARLFAAHPLLDVCYELLCDNYQAQMARVEDFLGVRHESVTPKTHRQSEDSLPAAIVNYYELKERFHGTEWYVFFEE